MKFNFKKIGSIIASSVMLASTIGFAAAANYPAPFVKEGTADGAIVYGASAAVTDITSAIDVQQSLGTLVKSATGTTAATVTGEATPLYTGGTKLYINDSLNAVKTVLTKTNLPTVLADGSFSGNVDATFTQKIDIGSNPKVTFAKQPTSSDDPKYALTLSTSTTKYIYNETVTFSKAINASHADSEGEELDIFGSKFTIGSATDGDTLVLLKSAEKISLDSNNPSQEVTVGGKTYTIELVSASDTAATIKVTDSSGNSESKEINEAQSKKVNGLSIAVQTADETNLKLSASVIAGTDKITLEDGNNVKIGEDDKIIDGTKVGLTGGVIAGTMPVDKLSAITISVFADNSDADAILPGKSFVDPVFGTIKVDFSGFNIDSTVGSADTSRDTISFSSSGDDKLNVKFKDYNGNEKMIQYFKNQSTANPSGPASAILSSLQCGDNGNNITVMEQEKFHKDDCVVVGNEDNAYLLKLVSVRNSSSTTASDDVVEFKDMMSDAPYRTSFITNDGSGTIDIGGISYAVTLQGDYNIADTMSYNVSLNYPDSSGDGSIIMYPTIQTSKGAKIMFYEPKLINMVNYNDDTYEVGTAGNLTELKFPNGADGYTSVTSIRKTVDGNFTLTVGGTAVQINLSGSAEDVNSRLNITVGQLVYVLGNTTIANRSSLKLLNAAGDAVIDQPAVVIFEEKDDNSNYEAIIVETDAGANSDDGAGIDTVEDTWSNAASGWSTSRYSDSKIADRGDLWGTIMTLNSGDSDQKSATISYPDDQIFAQIYIGEDTSSITPGTAGAGGQVIIVKDSEVSSVSAKNLFVVGGSCINAVAAKILGSDVPLCGEDFTAKTQVGAGQYIIKTVASPYNTAKVAMLVAGYNAADTVNAVAKAKEGVSTDISAEGQVYPIVSASA